MEVAIAYIDCDLYDPALDTLNFITPFIKQGTILIFDDWFRNKGNPHQGVQGAVLKWLENNKRFSFSTIIAVTQELPFLLFRKI